MSKKNYTNSLMPRRLHKKDIVELLPAVAVLLTNACKLLWDSNEIPEFSDKGYLKYVCVEILHGERWRRVVKIHNLDNAIEEVRYVHFKFRSIYLMRLNKEDDGIDRRIIQSVKQKQIIERGVNYKIYAED